MIHSVPFSDKTSIDYLDNQNMIYSLNYMYTQCINEDSSIQIPPGEPRRESPKWNPQWKFTLYIPPPDIPLESRSHPIAVSWVSKLLILQKDVFHYLPHSSFTGTIQVEISSLRTGGWLIPSHCPSLSELWNVKYFPRSKSFEPNLKMLGKARKLRQI